MEPLALYRLWERQNWSSHEIDLSRDRADWEALRDELRDEMLWGLSAFFVGEERVTNQFSGLVLAAEDKHEEAFLLTQQVDEARHAQHFNRLYEEVFRLDGSFEDRLERGPQGPHRGLLHAVRRVLVDAHAALLADPRDIGAKVEFVTLYHMVIEGTLALTGQRFQTDNLEQRAILPGHLEAFKLISRDEHRHVAYGTWFLQQKARDPDLAARMQETLARTLPAAAGVLVPRGYQLGDEYEYLGYDSQTMNEFAFTALSRRLKVIGVGLPAVAG